MKTMIYWVMAAILVSSTSMFMSCSNDDAKLTSISLKVKQQHGGSHRRC